MEELEWVCSCAFEYSCFPCFLVVLLLLYYSKGGETTCNKEGADVKESKENKIWKAIRGAPAPFMYLYNTLIYYIC